MRGAISCVNGGQPRLFLSPEMREMRVKTGSLASQKVQREESSTVHIITLGLYYRVHGYSICTTEYTVILFVLQST